MMSQNLSAMYEHAKKQSTNAGTQDPVVTPKPFDPNAPKPSAFGGGSAFGTAPSAFGGNNGGSFGSGSGSGTSAFAQAAFNKPSVFGGGGGTESSRTCDRRDDPETSHIRCISQQ